MKMSEIMEGGTYVEPCQHLTNLILHHNVLASYDFMSKEQATSQSEFLGDCLRLLTHTFSTLQLLPVSTIGNN